MEDLEVLCRTCHEAHHAAERSSACLGRGNHKPFITPAAAYRLLSRRQRMLICSEHHIEREAELYLKMISAPRAECLDSAERMLGCRIYDGKIGMAMPPVRTLQEQKKQRMEKEKEMFVREIVNAGVRVEWASQREHKLLKNLVRNIRRGGDLMQLVGKRNMVAPPPEPKR